MSIIKCKLFNYIKINLNKLKISILIFNYYGIKLVMLYYNEIIDILV